MWPIKRCENYIVHFVSVKDKMKLHCDFYENLKKYIKITFVCIKKLFCMYQKNIKIEKSHEKQGNSFRLKESTEIRKLNLCHSRLNPKKNQKTNKWHYWNNWSNLKLDYRLDNSIVSV